MTSTILAESRRGDKVVLIERAGGEASRDYRVSVFLRFSSLAKAQAAFLAELPPSAAEHYKAEIAEQDNLARDRYTTLK